MATESLIDDAVVACGHDVLDMSPDELAAEVERQLLELSDGESSDDDGCSESLAAGAHSAEAGDQITGTASNSHSQAVATETAVGGVLEEDEGNRSAWAALMESVAVNSKAISRFEEQLRSVQKIVAGEADPDEELTDDEVDEVDPQGAGASSTGAAPDADERPGATAADNTTSTSTSSRAVAPRWEHDEWMDDHARQLEATARRWELERHSWHKQIEKRQEVAKLDEEQQEARQTALAAASTAPSDVSIAQAPPKTLTTMGDVQNSYNSADVEGNASDAAGIRGAQENGSSVAADGALVVSDQRDDQVAKLRAERLEAQRLQREEDEAALARLAREVEDEERKQRERVEEVLRQQQQREEHVRKALRTMAIVVVQTMVRGRRARMRRVQLVVQVAARVAVQAAAAACAADARAAQAPAGALATLNHLATLAKKAAVGAAVGASVAAQRASADAEHAVSRAMLLRQWEAGERERRSVEARQQEEERCKAAALRAAQQQKCARMKVAVAARREAHAARALLDQRAMEQMEALEMARRAAEKARRAAAQREAEMRARREAEARARREAEARAKRKAAAAAAGRAAAVAQCAADDATAVAVLAHTAVHRVLMQRQRAQARAAARIQCLVRGAAVRRRLRVALASATYVDDELDDLDVIDVDAFLGSEPDALDDGWGDLEPRSDTAMEPAPTPTRAHAPAPAAPIAATASAPRDDAWAMEAAPVSGGPVELPPPSFRIPLQTVVDDIPDGAADAEAVLQEWSFVRIRNSGGEESTTRATAVGADEHKREHTYSTHHTQNPLPAQLQLSQQQETHHVVSALRPHSPSARSVASQPIPEAYAGQHRVDELFRARCSSASTEPGAAALTEEGSKTWIADQGGKAGAAQQASSAVTREGMVAAAAMSSPPLPTARSGRSVASQKEDEIVGEWGFASKKTQALLRKRIRRQRKFASAKQSRNRSANPQWRFKKLMRGNGNADDTTAELDMDEDTIQVESSVMAASNMHTKGAKVSAAKAKAIRTTRFPPINLAR